MFLRDQQRVAVRGGAEGFPRGKVAVEDETEAVAAPAHGHLVVIRKYKEIVFARPRETLAVAVAVIGEAEQEALPGAIYASGKIKGGGGDWWS